MKNKKLTIGISLRVVENTDYNEKRDALSQDWSQFFERLGINPLLIPNTIKNISEFNIGHFIISESIFTGLEKTIRKFKKIINLK